METVHEPPMDYSLNNPSDLTPLIVHVENKSSHVNVTPVHRRFRVCYLCAGVPRESLSGTPAVYSLNCSNTSQ